MKFYFESGLPTRPEIEYCYLLKKKKNRLPLAVTLSHFNLSKKQFTFGSTVNVPAFTPPPFFLRDALICKAFPPLFALNGFFVCICAAFSKRGLHMFYKQFTF